MIGAIVGTERRSFEWCRGHQACRAGTERAAAALADAGVARVVLFGSVARGEALDGSDIDLMAIYDDLDYSQRRAKEVELVSTAGAASGYPVDVVVTDRPEWKVRVEGVRASLESRAARDGVVLVDRPSGVVHWDKKMVMPIDDYQEALFRLGLVDNCLLGLRERLEPSSVERIEQEMGNEVRAFDVYLVRLRRACGHAHGAVEASLKVLIHLGAGPGTAAWGHASPDCASNWPSLITTLCCLCSDRVDPALSPNGMPAPAITGRNTTRKPPRNWWWNSPG